MHSGSILASYPAAPGLSPGFAEIFSLLLSLWTVEDRSDPYSANEVSGEGLI